MNNWPFIIVRSFGCGGDNDNFFQELFAAQKRYPGLIDEIWFGGSSIDGVDDSEAKIRRNLPYREKCQEHGICFSYQQGVTLNHRSDGRDHAEFSDDAWCVDEDGVLHKGILCPRSPEAYEYNFKTAQMVMTLMKPDSYWLDDDDRLLKMDRLLCCCDRCLAAFNKKYNHNYSRAELKSRLKSDDFDTALNARREWTAFNRESIAYFTRVYRDAADQVMPDCRFGFQTISSDIVYDGEDFKLALEALSGKEKKKVGIRPGAGYYQDNTPQDMLRKSLNIQKEGARSSQYGFVGQICAEVENWPHISAIKNPDGEMAESSLYLASGADSLALYWGCDKNSEKPEIWQFFFERLSAWKPFLQTIRDAFAGTYPGGAATYLGSGKLGLESWVTECNDAEFRLMVNAVPVTRMNANPEVYALNGNLARAVMAEDLPVLFSKPVLLDVAAFQILAEKFPQQNFFKKVDISFIQSSSGVTDTGDLREVFDSGKTALNLNYIITPASSDVIPLSQISKRPGTCGSCIIPTGLGSSIVLVQELDNRNLWTSYRREMILNALDRLIPAGGLSVRLLTGGFSICIKGRTAASGTTAGAYLLNCGIGKTMPLEIAIRRSADKDYWLYRPEQEPVKLTPARETADEKIYILPPLEAWKPALIATLKDHA